MLLTPSVYWPILVGGAVLLYAYSSPGTANDYPDSMPKWPGSQHATGVTRQLVNANRLPAVPRFGKPFVPSPDIQRLG